MMLFFLYIKQSILFGSFIKKISQNYYLQIIILNIKFWIKLKKVKFLIGKFNFLDFLASKLFSFPFFLTRYFQFHFSRFFENFSLSLLIFCFIKLLFYPFIIFNFYFNLFLFLFVLFLSLKSKYLGIFLRLNILIPTIVIFSWG